MFCLGGLADGADSSDSSVHHFFLAITYYPHHYASQLFLSPAIKIYNFMELKVGIYVVSEALIHSIEFNTVIFLLCSILDRNILRISLSLNHNSLLDCSSSPMEKELIARSGMSVWG